MTFLCNKVFWELNGEIFFEKKGKSLFLKLHSGLKIILQTASISGSPFQKFAWISGLIKDFFPALYFRLWTSSKGNPLCQRFLWLVYPTGSNIILLVLTSLQRIFLSMNIFLNQFL